MRQPALSSVLFILCFQECVLQLEKEMQLSFSVSAAVFLAPIMKDNFFGFKITQKILDCQKETEKLKNEALSAIKELVRKCVNSWN